MPGIAAILLLKNDQKSLFCRMYRAVLSWRCARFKLEAVNKITNVVISAVDSDFRYRLFCFFQHFLRVRKSYRFY